MKTPNLLRNIPSVSELLESPPLKTLVNRVSHNVVVGTVRTFLDDLRRDLARRADQVGIPPVGELAERIAKRILTGEQTGLQRVINATGILLHTGLGRAPLADDAIEALIGAARDYSNVELDLATGQRSQRNELVSPLIAQLTGAEAALVVNNNAGATMLALNTLARDRAVVVSRGQLVEIGGSYRLPDVMAASGARLCEVGTTNKTRASDYTAAINENTAALMRVHTSNYRVVGFTEDVSIQDLVALGRKHNLPVIDDIGSGALIDFREFGVAAEPLAADSIRAGADLVLFSGDKLLGGPQCGIIAGRRELVQRIASNPMARALRVDKLTLAALSATLRIYRNPERAVQQIPLLALLNTPMENLKNRAERLAPQLAALPHIESAEAVEDIGYLGGGSLPEQQIKTWCVALAPREGGVDRMAQALRTGTPSVVARVQQSRVLLDLRSVFPRQDLELVAAVEALSGGAES